ncbi:hypothetical protein [Paenibacillus donghaensis]|uniref:Uncharacterized protein n=1 Tax=Paenibacillus donghaensis TaxID=414771 RepID=A0A2Z2KFB5_9BACL|nr:hypothetical protein [Paenibacillus donghaensis]ASA20789.1 hypothetical protein B9T62_08325 [Paenibacillus donghaensis]
MIGFKNLFRSFAAEVHRVECEDYKNIKEMVNRFSPEQSQAYLTALIKAGADFEGVSPMAFVNQLCRDISKNTDLKQ